MTVRKICLSILILLAIFLTVNYANFVQAQEQSAFSVSPPSFEINSIPGTVLNNTIKVDNLSSFPMKIKAAPQNFVAYGEGGQVSITEDESSFSISQWIRIENDEKIIAPNSFALYDFTIDIPKNAEAGSHYGAVVFTSIPDNNLEGAGAIVSQEIGSLILIKLPGDIFENAKILQFNSNKKIYNDGNVVFNTLIENTGNVHIKPYGFINITNVLGQKVKNFEVKGRNILPGSKRLFTEEVKFENSGFYNAEVTLLYSGGGKILTSKTSFLALNLVALRKYIILAGILFIIYLLFFKRVNKALKVFFRG